MKTQTSKSKEQESYWTKNGYIPDQSQADFSKTAYFTAKVNLKFYEQSFIAKSDQSIALFEPPPLRMVGDIESFSKNSRTRMIKFFSTISLSSYRKLVFTSLSFHFDCPPDSKSLKRFLDNYLKRISRNYSGISWIWRFEYQKRGTPHFHFVFFIPNKLEDFSIGKFIRSIRNSFLDLKKCHCFDCCKYGFDFDELETPTKAFSYISKYCAKLDGQVETVYTGRRWGYKRNIITNPVRTLTLRGYQFQYFKKLLFDYYREKATKANYIRENEQSLRSWFLLCSFDAVDSCLKKLFQTKLERIFYELQKEKLLDSELVLDYNNCIISLSADLL